jgi:hypothetical protein
MRSGAALQSRDQDAHRPPQQRRLKSRVLAAFRARDMPEQSPRR